MTVQEYAAAAIEKSTEDLIRVARELPEDKWGWQPLDRGRSALSQMAECAAQNTLDAKLVRAGTWQQGLMAEWQPLVAALDTPEKAIAALRAGTLAPAEAVRETPDASLEAEIAMPSAPVTLAQLFLMSVWNMSYHEGQITYIGTLLA